MFVERDARSKIDLKEPMKQSLEFERNGIVDGMTEEKWIAEYMELTGARQNEARNVYMFLEVTPQRYVQCLSEEGTD